MAAEELRVGMQSPFLPMAELRYQSTHCLLN